MISAFWQTSQFSSRGMPNLICPRLIFLASELGPAILPIGETLIILAANSLQYHLVLGLRL
jgi:hypothetical protein